MQYKMSIVTDKMEEKNEFIHNNLEILNLRFDPLMKKMWRFALNFF
jgi:hypothetical protein